MKYKPDLEESVSSHKYLQVRDKGLALYHIANELAEQNRLTRLDLEMKYKGYAKQRLYKSFKDGEGKSITIPPDDKDKEEYKLECEAILKECSDQAIDDQTKGEKK